MVDDALFPFADGAAWQSQYCKLPLHTGAGSVVRHGSTVGLIRRMQQMTGEEEPKFEASFLVPPAGNCLISLRWPDEGGLSRNFGEGLTVVGESPEGPFRLFCPQYYIKSASREVERPVWAVAVPTNQPATVSYGDPRPIARVSATINNFDFDHGNQDGNDGQERSEVLRVEAAGRIVDFVWRSGRVQLRRLVEAGVIGTTSLVTFSFAAWSGAS